MDIDLTRNYFELFGLSVDYEINQEELSEKYRAFQSALHPDRFVSATDQERRISVQNTAFVNEGYNTLKSDLKRAHYLLKLSDIEFDAETETSDDAEFLMQQMQLHERVEQAEYNNDPLSELDLLAAELKQQQADLVDDFAKQYAANELLNAKNTALKLQFYERLTKQVKKNQEKLEEQLL